MLENKLYKISLGVCLLLTYFIGLAIFGFFKSFYLLSGFFLFLLFSIFIFWKGFKKIFFEKKELLIVLLCLLITVFISSFYHDLPSGRDNMSYIFGATKLSETGSLTWRDILSRPIHGVRDLGNDVFTSQFLPGYIVFLASFYKFGGLNLLLRANALLVFLSLIFLYFVGKNLKNRAAGIISILFLSSSYLFIWFSRETISENLFLFLLLFCLALFILGFKKKNFNLLSCGFIPVTLILLVRGEGLLYVISYLIVFFVVIRWQKIKVSSFKKTICLFAPSLINIALFKDYLLLYKQDYILGQFKEFFESFFAFLNHIPGSILLILLLIFVFALFFVKKRLYLSWQRIILFSAILFVILFETTFIFLIKYNQLSWSFFRIQYALEMFCYYFFIIYIFFILCGLARKLFTKLDFFLVAIISPSFLFIIEPHIALDQPWFMRRFFPTVLPLLIILASQVICRLNLKKSYLVKVCLFVLALNLIFSFPILFFQKNKGVQKQLKEFSQNFSEKDFIAFQPGWSWQKWAISLHYIYNLNIIPNLDLYPKSKYEDLFPKLIKKYPNWKDNNLDLLAIKNEINKLARKEYIEITSSYENIYVISLAKEEAALLHPYYDTENLEFQGTFNLKYTRLRTTSPLTSYIKLEKGNLDLKKIRKMEINIPPQDKNFEEYEFAIYKVKNKKRVKDYQEILPDQEYVSSKENVSISRLTPNELQNFRKLLEGLRD